MSAPQPPAPATASTPSTSSAQPLCSMCDQPAKDVCNVCRCSRYCSKICQKDDWPVHKLLCKTFKDFPLSKIPGPNHYRAISFPEMSTKPEFCWMRITPAELAQPFVAMIVRDAATGALRNCRLKRRPHFSNNDVLTRSHQPIYTLSVDGDGGLRGRPGPNNSVRKIDQELVENTKGMYLFHGLCAHLDLQDFRHIVDCLRTQYYFEYLQDQFFYQLSITRCFSEGVRINCQGDEKISGLPHLQSFKANKNFFDIGSAQELSIAELPITLVLGFPLLVRRIGSGLPWKYRHIRGNSGHTYAHNMYIMCVSPAHLDSVTGTLLVARKDKKPLYEAHMHALLGYCIRIGGTMTVDHTADTDPSRDLDQEMHLQLENREKKILREASQESFLQYYISYMSQVGREKHGDVPSPYHV